MKICAPSVYLKKLISKKSSFLAQFIDLNQGHDYATFLMASKVFSFIDTKQLTVGDIKSLFSQAKEIKAQFYKSGRFPDVWSQNPLITLLFFEASTRTRFSFDVAIQRLSGSSIYFDGASKEGTSLVKGESLADTFWTVHAMRPDAIVVRCGADLDLKALTEQTEVPLVNAGLGSESHPTQALLDTFTLLEHFPSVEGRKILFVGDINHSRVAHSHMEMLPRLGAEVAVVGPESFLAGTPKNIKQFESLKEAIPWADVCVCLRVQFERHGDKASFAKDEFIKNYQVHGGLGSLFKKEALLFHPGPVNWGIEMNPNVKSLPAFKMWEQKENGVYTRAALLRWIFEKNGRSL